MKTIESISIGYIEQPLKTPFITSLRRVDTAKDIIVILFSNSGKQGYGSATGALQVTGETLQNILFTITETIIPYIMRKIQGELIEPQELSKYLTEVAPKYSSARACFESAYCDLYAKEYSDGLFEYFKVKKNNFQTCYTISSTDKKKMLEQTQLACNNQFITLKLKLGKYGIDQDIETVKLLSDNTPPDCKFIIDPNQAWTFADSKKFIDTIDQGKILVLEQPVLKHNTIALTELSKYSQVPIFADESIFNLKQLEKLFALNAMDGVVIKLLKAGGFYPAFEMINFCHKNGVKIMVSSMLETKLGVYNSLLVASKSDDNCIVDLDAAYLQDGEPFLEGFKQVHSKIILSKEPLEILDRIKNQRTIWRR